MGSLQLSKNHITPVSIHLDTELTMSMKFPITDCRVDCTLHDDKENIKEIKIMLNTGKEITFDDQDDIDQFQRNYFEDDTYDFESMYIDHYDFL